MKYFVYLYLLISSLLHTEIHSVMLGDTKVDIIKQTGKGKVLVHLHENELTALNAAKFFVDVEGGSLITLRHSGKRNIRFNLQGTCYEFDPNRIFTDKGIKNTLKNYGPYSKYAHREVKKFANKIINLLPKGKIIAVHNNREYSIKEYLPKHALSSDAKSLNYPSKINYRNFYLVTSNKEYKRLKYLKFNVVLQSEKAKNDGSLSFYLAKKNYVNIETAYGELKEQIKMLYNA